MAESQGETCQPVIVERMYRRSLCGTVTYPLESLEYAAPRNMIRPEFQIWNYGAGIYWIRKPFKFIVQFEHHCKMARIPLMIAGTVVVLLCVLEIHAVIIAQRDDKSTCMPAIPTSLLISPLTQPQPTPTPNHNNHPPTTPSLGKLPSGPSSPSRSTP